MCEQLGRCLTNIGRAPHDRKSVKLPTQMLSQHKQLTNNIKAAD